MKISKETRNFIADSIEKFINVREQCLISSDSNSEEMDKNIKKAKKLIHKIRKGDMSVFNEERLKECLPDIEKEREEYERGIY